MDPITAISIASAILTFIDTASKIVTGTYEILQSASGATAANEHIEIIVDDLCAITAELDTPDSRKYKRDDRALRTLASNCQRVSEELRALLETLKVSGNHTTWKSLTAKIKSMRKEKEIAEMEKKLGDYRAQILLRLNVMLR